MLELFIGMTLLEAGRIGTWTNYLQMDANEPGVIVQFFVFIYVSFV